jgi:hypothetical protein
MYLEIERTDFLSTYATEEVDRESRATNSPEQNEGPSHRVTAFPLPRKR